MEFFCGDEYDYAEELADAKEMLLQKSKDYWVKGAIKVVERHPKIKSIYKIYFDPETSENDFNSFIFSKISPDFTADMIFVNDQK